MIVDVEMAEGNNEMNLNQKRCIDVCRIKIYNTLGARITLIA